MTLCRYIHRLPVAIMKTSWSSVQLVGMLALSSQAGVAAFSSGASRPSFQTTTPSSTLSLNAVSRRDWCQGIATGAASAILAAGSSPASAALNYEQVQDLLNTPAETAGASNIGRPTYLKEPTAEFKENEQKAAVFKRQQLQAKQSFVTALNKIATDPDNEDMLASDLDDLRRQVKKENGLPAGIVRDEVVRQVRRRKAKRYWPTQVEIAYQDLMNEIRFQQSPNQASGDSDKKFL